MSSFVQQKLKGSRECWTGRQPDCCQAISGQGNVAQNDFLGREPRTLSNTHLP
jgi:hypothetical protein